MTRLSRKEEYFIKNNKHTNAPRSSFEDLGPQAGMQHPAAPINPLNSALYGASTGLIGSYGERIIGSSTEYVQSNISKYFSDPQYYFQVNDQYVKNKLKVVLFPFLHRGHWTRIAEQIPGGLTYKPPINDINAPDLYIPLMAFGSYIVLSGLMMGFLGKFNPEALSIQFTKGILGWFAEFALLWLSLKTLSSGGAPLLDIISYGGYAFVGISLSVLARILFSYSYYVVMPWTCLCMSVFLVKTMKRILFAEVRSHSRDSSKHHYFLLFTAIAQFPLFLWLGYITG